MNEFTLIANYFTKLIPSSLNTTGIGDDCAILSIPQHLQLVQSVDTLVQGVHFPLDCDPALLGYRALSICLSDLAAMGASPHSFLLSLTLPQADEHWLENFSHSLLSLAESLSLHLIGGDITKGPLTITLCVQGTVPKNTALRRQGAKLGDHIYVSGTLGDSAAALKYVLEPPTLSTDPNIQYLLNRYYKPPPRIALATWLRENGASAALDISDGFLGDLNHMLSASQVGAIITLDHLPLSEQIHKLFSHKQAMNFALNGGDDYELCFTWPGDIPPPEPSLIPAVTITKVGTTTAQLGIQDHHHNAIPIQGYSHF